MKQSTRTMIFLATAIGAMAVAAVSHTMTQPPTITGFERVGQPFYEDFTNPNEATALRVVAYDEDTASTRLFKVEYKDGMWRIPSHHYYPADGEDRLAETAASIIGVERGALAGRRESDHERFGVIDPLDEESTALKGRGQRITLFKEGDVPVVDLIIGKQIEGTTDEYYVRRQDEDETYRTRLEINISTKFADWVEQDLLKLNRDELVAMKVTTPNVAQQSLVVEDLQEETLELTRPGSSDPWTMKGLDEAQEELQTSEVNSMVSALDNLKLVGIRPKPMLQEGKPLLTGDLKLNLPEAVARNPALANSVQQELLRDLSRKGFFIVADENNKPRIYSREGEVVAATNQGVVYHLHFGNVFTGSDEEIEIGLSAEEADAKETGKDQDEGTEAADGEQDSAESEKKESEAADESKDDGKQSRYLFVRVEFDPNSLGPEPVEPQKPEKPAGLEEESTEASASADAEAESAATEASEAAKTTDDKPNADDKSEGADNPEASDKKADEPKQPDPKAEYEAAMKEYEQALAKYKADKTAYETKLKEGQETVEELNTRFADWYYVISNDSFEDLRPTRATLVKAKEAEEAAKDGAETSAGPAPATPGSTATPPAEPKAEQPAEAKPATPKSEASTPKEDQNPPESKDASAAPAQDADAPQKVDAPQEKTTQSKEAPTEPASASGDSPSPATDEAAPPSAASEAKADESPESSAEEPK